MVVELRLERHEALGSTNDRCLALAREGAPAGTLVVASAQTKGRGQRGAAWHSPAGEGLYASLLLRPRIPPSQAPLLTLAAGLALARQVDRIAPGRVGLKWPNDLWVAERPGATEALAGRKLAGILVEGSVDTDAMHHAVIGVGLNLRGSPERREAGAVALETLVGPDVDIAFEALTLRLAGDIADAVGQLEAGDASTLIQAWTVFALGVGGEVVVEQPPERLAGVFRGLDPTTGAPRVEIPASGEIRAFPHGRVVQLEPRFFPG